MENDSCGHGPRPQKGSARSASTEELGYGGPIEVGNGRRRTRKDETEEKL